MTWTRLNLADPTNYRAALRASLEAPDLELLQDNGDGPPEAQRAGLALAIALGQCRRTGTEPGPDLDGTLLPRVVRAAAIALQARVEAILREARALPSLWDGDNWLAGEETAINLVDARTLFWLAEAALEEGLLSARNRGAPLLDAVEQALDNATQCLKTLDITLLQFQPLLTAVTATQLLENTRKRLSASQRDHLPWWLDGRLERLAQEQLSQADESVEELRRVIRPAPDSHEAPRILGFKPSRLPDIVAASTGVASVPDFSKAEQIVLTWESPDRTFLARIRLPGKSSETEETRLVVLSVICRVDRSNATDLLPVAVEVAGLRLDLDENARCRVPLANLRKAKTLTFRLEGQSGFWTPRESNDE